MPMYRPRSRDQRSLCARLSVRVPLPRSWLAGLCTGASILAGCDLPTALPKWETVFVVQSDSTTLASAQLLPASATITEDNRAFAISLSPVAFSQELGALCATCAPLNAQNAPRPALLGTFGATIALPADIAAVTVVGGHLNIAVHNGFSFDPLRAADETGTVTIIVKSLADVIATKVLTGITEALPAGNTLFTSLPIAGNVDGGLNVAVEVSSPAGENTRINTGEKLRVTATPSHLRASSARVRVPTRHVTAKPIALNLASLDRKIINSARSGAILLSIRNPLGVNGSLLMSITGGVRTVTKPVTFAAGDSNVEVALDEAELKTFLGHDVVMTLAGYVSATSNVTLAPDQNVTVASRLKLLLGPDN